MKQVSKIYLTPTPVRIWHWLNAFGILTLTVTGAQIRFPDYVNPFGTYKAAIALHDAAGIVVAVSFLLWLGYYLLVAGTLTRLYVPNCEELRRGVLRQALYYFFNYFRGRPNPHHSSPENKFNPMQKSAYLVIMMLLMPLVILSGVLLLNIGPLRELILMIGGLKYLAELHFLLACCMVAFLFTHAYLATLGHTPFAHFVPMWTGWEEVEEGSEPPSVRE
jgi:thiosulfate reductase cytochrome b subunit